MFEPENNLNPLAEAVVDAIDAGLKSKRGEQPQRQYLGASRVGADCERQLAYEFHLIPKDEGADFKGKTLRIFDMGHDGEERMAEYIKMAGFELQTHTPEGKQIGMSDAGGKFKGHLDGVIHGGPKIEGLKYPCLWENKALGSKSWNDMQKHGVKKSKPVYYAQIQVYMGYHTLETCLFTALNRDTGEIYVEMVDLNTRDCQTYIDRAVRIVSSANPEELGKAGRGADDFKCKWCDYKKRCHSVTTTAKTTNTPNWL